MEIKSKHKWVNVAGVIAIIFFAIVFYYSKETKQRNNDETRTTNSRKFAYDEFVYDDMRVKYKKHEFTENMSGEKCIVIYYEFTNNSNENKVFDYNFTDKAFQNGVELDFSLFHVNEESKNSDREIQPNTTVTVASAFVINSESDIILEVQPFISFSDEKLMEMRFSVK